MARTKGITLRVRRQPEDDVAAATDQSPDPTEDVIADDHLDEDEEETMRAHKRIRLTSSRSRSTRLSRAQSSEVAFEDESPSLLSSPSRKSRRQSTRHDAQEEIDNMDQDDQDVDTYAHEATPSGSRSRSARNRAKPQTPKSTPQRSRANGARTARAARSSLAASATPDNNEENYEDDGADKEVSEEAQTPEEEDAEVDVDVDADADADGDENDNEDEETGIDEEGHHTVTIKGQVYRLEGEEVVLPTDSEGEKKIDAKGRLQGGRQYKAYNFTSDLRSDPDKVYMLAIDAARATGYRDSLYFFRKNPQILKLELLQSEKDKLIEDGRLSGQLKSRNVTMVPARNVYKLHGARIITTGRAIIDDYYEADARASGVKEGKLVSGVTAEEPERRRDVDRDRERPKKKTDTFSFTTIDPQGDPVLTVFGDAGLSPWIRAGAWQSRKAALQRADVTEENWMLEMARSVQGMNKELTETRKDRLSAFPRFNRFIGLQEQGDGDGEEDETIDGEAVAEDDPEAINDLPPWEREKQPKKSPAQIEVEAQQRKAAEQKLVEEKRRHDPPLGVYEPNTHLPHFNLLSQPTRATMVKTSQRPLYVDDPGREAGNQLPILGGDKMGSGAWGIASFSFESLPPASRPAYRVVPSGASALAFDPSQ